MLPRGLDRITPSSSHVGKVLLHGSKNALGVIPWLVHGIQHKARAIELFIFLFLTGSRGQATG
ncbi:MAG: hypothetical protein ACRYE8_01900 [Janthinobacterium lividum]